MSQDDARPRTLGALRLSPTSLATAIDCMRKAAYRVLDRRRAPDTPSKLLGTRAHHHAELWLERNRYPAADPATLPPEMIDVVDDAHAARLAASWIKHIPPRVQRAEREVWVRTPNGLIGGRIDFDYIDDAGWLGIGDFKTSSDVRRHARTTETLPEDVPAVVYAATALRERPEQPIVPLRWIYAQTRGRAHDRAVDAVVTREHVETRIEALDRAIVAPLADARRRGLRAIDITPDPTACQKYGGCPFRAECPLTEKQVLEAMMKQDNGAQQTMFEKLRGLAGAGEVPPGPYRGVNRPEPERAEVAAPAPTVQAPAPAPSIPASPFAVAVAPLTPAAPAAPRVATPPAPVVESAPAVADQGAPQNAPPTTDQRPPLDQARKFIEQAIAAADGAPPQPSPPVVEAQTPAPAPTPSRGRGFVLVLNAQVSPAWPWGEVFDLTGLVRRAARRVAEMAGVPDYRLIEYGKGPGALAAMVAQMLDAEGPAPGQLAALASCPEADHVIAEIRERAMNSAAPDGPRGGVIEGVR